MKDFVREKEAIKARGGPTILDVLIPFAGTGLELIALVRNLVEKTELGFRLVLCDDGNSKDVHDAIRAIAIDHDKLAMVAFRNEQPLGFMPSLKRCKEHVIRAHQWWAVLHPAYHIESNTWFGQMIAPLQRDGIAYASVANAGIKWNSMPPIRLGRAVVNIPLSLAMFKRTSNPPLPEGTPASFGNDLRKQAIATGNTIWEVPACRLKPLSGRVRFGDPSVAQLKSRAALATTLVINR